MKPKVKECLQLRDTDKPKILGIVRSGLVLLDLMGSEVRLSAQQFPETGAGRKKFGGTHQGTGQAEGHLLRPGKSSLACQDIIQSYSKVKACGVTGLLHQL